MRSDEERKKVFKCRKCQRQLAYIVVHDAYACLRCNEWSEKNCMDPKCDYCRTRREKPKQER